MIQANNCIPIALPVQMAAKSVVDIHRISRANDSDLGLGVAPIPDVELTGPLLREWFEDCRPYRPGAYTGGRMPYALVTRTDGTTDQCLPLGAIAPHARGHNRIGIGWAFVGDFTVHPPTGAQVHTATQLGALFLARGIRIQGHTERPGGSSDPNKKCPGPLFPLAEVRLEAEAMALHMTHEDALGMLVDLGYVL